MRILHLNLTKITIGVSKVYKNTGSLRFHRKKTKPAWKHYFMSDDYTDELTLGTEWVDSIKAQLLKLNKWHLRKFICERCFNPFQAYIKNDRMEAECPYCPDDEELKA